MYVLWGYFGPWGNLGPSLKIEFWVQLCKNIEYFCRYLHMQIKEWLFTFNYTVIELS